MIDAYFRALSVIMAHESELMGELYRHPGKLGENREALLARFLEAYLPRRYDVGSGFALFSLELSTQQDVVVYDAVDNPVLFPHAAAPLFPPSAPAALIEVKSRLDKSELRRSARKAAQFKRLLRASFVNHPAPPECEALSMLFAFSSRLDPAQVLRTLLEVEDDDEIEMNDRVDLVCVLGEGLVVGGSLMYATTARAPLLTATPRPSQQRLAVAVEDSLFVFYARLLDYIGARPATRPQLMSYLPPETPMGVTVAVG